MRKSYKMVRELAESSINNLFLCVIDSVYGKNEIDPNDWLNDVYSRLWFAYMCNIISHYEYNYLKTAITVILGRLK